MSEILRPAPPRSIHRKLLVVLAEARLGKTLTIIELVERVIAAGHSDFTRYRAEGGRVRVVACSSKTVERAVRFALELGLIEDTGKLTRAGVKAVADAVSFNRAVSRATEQSMHRLGLSADELNAELHSGLAAGTVDRVPTIDNIVKGFRSRGLDEKSLRRHLQLLASCGGLPTVRKKFYLPRR